MAILLALASALAYGSSDFLGGRASTRVDAAAVGVGTQSIGLAVAAGLVVLLPGDGATGPALAWGALSGVGSAVGLLALYRGLAVGPMSVVATLSGVLNVVIPALVGLALGNRLSAGVAVGIALCVPAIALVSVRPGGDRAGRRTREATICGLVAGAGFALLFVALSRTGAHAGAWPLLPGQAVSLIGVGAVARRRGVGLRCPSPRVIGLVVCGGGLSVAATLLYLLATRRGELAIVAVLSALYPAATIALSRLVLHERLGRLQLGGLLVAAVGVVLVSAG